VLAREILVKNILQDNHVDNHVDNRTGDCA